MILDIIRNESKNHLLFIPVFLAIGILVFFNLSFDPELKDAVITLPIVFACIYISKYKKPFIVFFLIALGFYASCWRTDSISSPKLEKEIKDVWLSGAISEIIYKDGKKKTFT